jgi:hypothetical protein
VPLVRLIPGLGSPEMAKASADVGTFATGGVTLFTQRLDDLLSA